MASTGYETNLSDTPLNQPNEELQETSASDQNIEHKVLSCEVIIIIINDYYSFIHSLLIILLKHEVLKATRARGVNKAGSGGILDDIARDQVLLL